MLTVHRPQHNRRFSSTQSPPLRSEESRAEHLGLTLGLRQGSYLALTPPGETNPTAVKLIPQGSCDALFLLAFVQPTIPGCPTDEAQALFFEGLVRGHRRAKAFFVSHPPDGYFEAEPLTLAALLSYRHAFLWSQSLPSPLASEGYISPETLGELEQKVREEFRGYRGEDSVLVDVEGFLREGLRLFALIEPSFIIVPPREQGGGRYGLFLSAFALMYRFLESAPSDWETPANKKWLEEALAARAAADFSTWVMAKRNAEEGNHILNLGILLAQKLFYVEFHLELWPRESSARED